MKTVLNVPVFKRVMVFTMLLYLSTLRLDCEKTTNHETKLLWNQNTYSQLDFFFSVIGVFNNHYLHEKIPTYGDCCASDESIPLSLE